MIPEAAHVEGSQAAVSADWLLQTVALTCQFCGLSTLMSEEQRDLHYVNSCPQLTKCEVCQQMIEVGSQ